jgi:hypothetical protein
MFTVHSSLQAILFLTFLAPLLTLSEFFNPLTQTLDVPSYETVSHINSAVAKVTKRHCAQAENSSAVQKRLETAKDYNQSPSSQAITLSPDCVKTLYCIHANLKPGSYVVGEYRGYLGPNVTRVEAEALFDSPEMDGTAFHEWEEMLFPSWGEKWYWGNWNYSQLCYLSNRPEVRCACKPFVGAFMLMRAIDHVC